jgi:hypothetical protein
MPMSPASHREPILVGAVGLAGAALERRRARLVFLLFVPVTALTLGVLSTDSAPPRLRRPSFSSPLSRLSVYPQSPRSRRVGARPSP